MAPLFCCSILKNQWRWLRFPEDEDEELDVDRVVEVERVELDLAGVLRVGRL